MTCGACVSGIETQLSKLPGILTVSVSLMQQRCQVRLGEGMDGQGLGFGGLQLSVLLPGVAGGWYGRARFRVWGFAVPSPAAR